MWKLRNKRRHTSDRVDRAQERPVRRLSERLKTWLSDGKIWVLSRLEGIDNHLTNRQRKWLFYLALLCWSGFLFYLLGTAIRTPPSPFVLPFAADSSQTSLTYSK